MGLTIRPAVKSVGVPALLHRCFVELGTLWRGGVKLVCGHDVCRQNRRYSHWLVDEEVKDYGR